MYGSIAGPGEYPRTFERGVMFFSSVLAALLRPEMLV